MAIKAEKGHLNKTREVMATDKCRTDQSSDPGICHLLSESSGKSLTSLWLSASWVHTPQCHNEYLQGNDYSRGVLHFH